MSTDRPRPFSHTLHQIGLRPDPPRPGWAAALWLGGLLLAIGLLVGCANPQPPSGGPRDTTPPAIEASDPADGAVNVTNERVRITFTEYVEASSFQQALTVTPAFDQPLNISWSGREVQIRFPRPLRDSTTYILTIDKSFQDVRGVQLESPITLAFATGPRIEKGRLGGRVVGAARGQPVPGVDVYAYAASGGAAPTDSLPERPAYRTQTGEDGAFGFEYLREQRYYVVALRDNNRSRQPDIGEAYAPPPRPAIRADSAGTQVEVPWVMTRADTTRPTVTEVRARSRRRLEVRTREPVRLARRDTSDWTLRDSVTQQGLPVRAVYQRAQAPQRLVLETAPMAPPAAKVEEDDAAIPGYRLRWRAGVAVDTAGNALAAGTAPFAASTDPDTARVRFQAFTPSGLTPDTTGRYTLLPGMQPGLRFSQPPDSARLAGALAAQDSTGARPVTFTTDDGTTYRLAADPPLTSGQVLTVQLGGAPFGAPDTTYERTFRRISSRQLGSLSGAVRLARATSGRGAFPDTARTARAGRAARSGPPRAPGRAAAPRSDTTRTAATRADTAQADTLRADTAQTGAVRTGAAPDARSSAADTVAVDSVGTVIVELQPPTSSLLERQQQAIDTTRQFTFERLPEDEYRFRAFLDRNGNGRWDGGRLVPYRPAEPIGWRTEPVSSRPRWNSVLDDALRIVLPARSTPAPLSPDTSSATP